MDGPTVRKSESNYMRSEKFSKNPENERYNYTNDSIPVISKIETAESVAPNPSEKPATSPVEGDAAAETVATGAVTDPGNEEPAMTKKEAKAAAKQAKLDAKAAKKAGKKPVKHKKLKIFLVVLAILAILGVGGYFGVKAYLNSLLDENLTRTKVEKKELSCVNVDGYVNILLLGVDARTMNKTSLEGSNTDCIIIMSINTKTNEINLISVYRDTFLPVSKTGYGKINSAMAIGGPENAIRCMNESLDLDIENYALFNWKMVAELVDSVDGVEVDVTEAEMLAVNHYIDETGSKTGLEAHHLTKSGKQTLDGVQAVTYARIRKGVGDDFKRTDRMRLVLKKTISKLKKESPTDLLKTMKMCLKYCETSMSNDDLLALATQLADLKVSKSIGFPYTTIGKSVDGASCVFSSNLATDVKRLHEEMFGQEDYEVSSKALSISNVLLYTYGSNIGTPYGNTSDSSSSDSSSSTTDGTTSSSTGSYSGSTGSASSGSYGSSSGGNDSGSYSGSTSGSSTGSSEETTSGSIGGETGGAESEAVTGEGTESGE